MRHYISVSGSATKFSSNLFNSEDSYYSVARGMINSAYEWAAYLKMFTENKIFYESEYKLVFPKSYFEWSNLGNYWMYGKYEYKAECEGATFSVSIYVEDSFNFERREDNDYANIKIRNSYAFVGKKIFYKGKAFLNTSTKTYTYSIKKGETFDADFY